MGRRSYLPENLDDILKAITEYRDAHHVGPTIRELGELCGYSTTSMLYRLEQLEAHGFIEREPGKMRTMRVIPPEERMAG